VGIPDIRKIIYAWYQPNYQTSNLILLADALIGLEIVEYKLAGILIYQEFLLKDLDHDVILRHVNDLFKEKKL
jgi:hypothetical protein